MLFWRDEKNIEIWIFITSIKISYQFIEVENSYFFKMYENKKNKDSLRNFFEKIIKILNFIIVNNLKFN